MENNTVSLLGKGLTAEGWEPVVNRLEEWGYESRIYRDYDDIDEPCRLGIILNYSSIVPRDTLEVPTRGFILFHSSDLPKGRGWAPIYNTMTRGLPLVQTMLYATEQVDAGPMIAKARYPLRGTEVENEVQDFDDKLTIVLIEGCLRDVLESDVTGREQVEKKSTYWEKRSPTDSEIDTRRVVNDVIDHIKALPDEAPPFCEYRDRTYEIDLIPTDPQSIEFDQQRVTLEKYY